MTETFDPNAHLIELEGKQYLPVAARVAWMRADHPDWGILAAELFADEEGQVYRFEAIIKDAEGKVIATGHGSERGAAFHKGPYEKAETVAVGRALAFAGYGTLQSLELVEDGTAKIADAPAEKPKAVTEKVAKEPVPATGGSKASTAQIGFLHKLWEEHDYSDEDAHLILADRYGVESHTELTKAQASDCIEWLKGLGQEADS